MHVTIAREIVNGRGGRAAAKHRHGAWAPHAGALAARLVVPAVACALYAAAFAALGPLGLVPGAGARAGLTQDEVYAQYLSVAHVKEPIQPEQTAASVLYLASEAARVVTGSSLVIDAGWSAT
jgi:NAD(P)-dependent dehydrogenase (short-subunit alcohol dehydrogenase family)